MPVRPPRLLPGASLALAALLLTACGDEARPGSSGSPAGHVRVSATDDSCELSRTELEAGTSVLAITNDGSQVTEVYVYGQGDRVVTEKEDLGPGSSYELTVDLLPGSYEVACRPGASGDGIRTAVTVGSNPGAASADPASAEAVAGYRSWVRAQAEELVPLVRELAAAVEAGDVERARSLYAPSRVPWERIEPVAESLGDLDPRVDLREADLGSGQSEGDWTGWHRLEKALWSTGDLSGMAPVAQQLVSDVKELEQRVESADITAVSIGNGAKELLDEVATGKITGEEEAFSHTDLVDFAANVEGARQAFQSLRPLVEAGDPQLVATLEREFADVEAALAAYRTGPAQDYDYVPYDTVGAQQRKQLARVVDALSEPLSGLAAAAAG